MRFRYEKWRRQLRVMNSELKHLINSYDEIPEIKEVSKDFYLALYERRNEMTMEIYTMFGDKKNNLFMEALTVLRDDKKVFDVMKTTLVMLLNSFTIDATYNLLKNFDYADCSNTEVLQSFLLPMAQLWQQQFRLIGLYIIDTDPYFSNTWKDIYPREVQSFTLVNPALTNQQMAPRLNDFLTAKYPWRQWLIVVTKDYKENTKFFIETCGGARFLNVDQRHMFITSTSLFEDTFQSQTASSLLKKVEGNVNFWYPYADQAKEINKMVGASCSDFAMFGAITMDDSDVWISGRHESLMTVTTVLKLAKENFIAFIM